MADKSSTTQNQKILSLIRLKPECKFGLVRVDFQAPRRPNMTPVSIIPTFNHDNSYFTPSFVLPSDKKYYQANSNFQKHQFQEKIQRSVQETNSIPTHQTQQDMMIALPNSNFCQICQEKFDCYYQHINLEPHRTKTHKSATSALIEELCEEFRKRQKKEGERKKTKGIRRDTKRQPKSLIEQKLNKGTRASAKENYSLLKSQNQSTCLIEDSPHSFIG